MECRDRAVPEASPPFSVVVSTRDRPAALANCLRSLGQLRHVVFEVVVVDNAPSDDEARRTFDRVVGGDERFRYVCEPLQGVSRARNRGLHMALFDHARSPTMTSSSITTGSRARPRLHSWAGCGLRYGARGRRLTRQRRRALLRSRPDVVSAFVAMSLRRCDSSEPAFPV